MKATLNLKNYDSFDKEGKEVDVNQFFKRFGKITVEMSSSPNYFLTEDKEECPINVIIEGENGNNAQLFFDCGLIEAEVFARSILSVLEAMRGTFPVEYAKTAMIH
jgi:hypothetical protein